MPQLKREVPDTLQPYVGLGVDLQWKGGKDATGDCPFCGREGKFNVLVETGQFRCVVCSESGNATVFVRKLWKIASETDHMFDELVEDRGFLDSIGLIQWDVVRSPLNGDWMLPGYSADGEINTLYSYRDNGQRKFLLPTKTLGHQLLGRGCYDKNKPIVYLCEGPWDGIALWEVLSQTKVVDDEFRPTGNVKQSLLSESSVLSMPTCSVFNESWLPLFAGKIVNLMSQSDHPHKNPKNDSFSDPAGYSGMLRVANLLAEQQDAPKEINILRWGPEGYDPERKSGYDLRDHLSGDLSQRVTAFGELVGMLVQFSTRQEQESEKTLPRAKDELQCISCSDYRKMIQAWKKAMKWTAGLEHGLSCMLATIISTKSVGDQLWMRVLSPASSGKSTLAEGISVARDYVYAKSTLRGFHSGYDDGSGENHSPLAKMLDKTLVVKDGDTLLQAPNLPQILSEARDIYDRRSRSSYRTRQSKDWVGINLTILLLGTSSLRQLDQSELGERFLTCTIMDRIDDDLEDEILMRVAHRSERNLAIEADGKAETHQDPDLTKAMQLTGGYVEYLRRNGTEILSQVEMSHEALHRCSRLGKFVSFMRARPSLRQQETAEREFAARLVSQLVRLSKCLAGVLGKREVDEDVLERTRRVALDTAHGKTLQITEHLYDAGHEGMTISSLCVLIGMSEDKTRHLLRFLREIRVVEAYTPTDKELGTRQRWRLLPTLKRLWEEVHS